MTSHGKLLKMEENLTQQPADACYAYVKNTTSSSSHQRPASTPDQSYSPHVDIDYPSCWWTLRRWLEFILGTPDLTQYEKFVFIIVAEDYGLVSYETICTTYAI